MSVDIGMRLYSIEDTTYVDSFNLPSIFDDRLALYKEWHDFVFFDRSKSVFGLLNFGILGNPYDSKRGCGSSFIFFVDPMGRTFTEMKLIPLSNLQISSYSPDFISDKIVVSYLENNSFIIKGEIRNISFDLNIPVIQPPVSGIEIFLDVLCSHKKVSIGMIRAVDEMAKLWDNWVEIPRLFFSGEVTLNGSTFQINSRTGYHDHEGGRFDWGSTWGWDTGVILCDPQISEEPESIGFLFYRYGPSDNLSHGGIIVETENGNRKYFDSENIKITRTGRFSGEQKIIPGITRLLYPDYNPHIPERIVFTAIDDYNELNITLKPRAVCSIVNVSLSGTFETELNEMFCCATLSGIIDGQSYNKKIPCWFEVARPRGRVSNNAVET